MWPRVGPFFSMRPIYPAESATTAISRLVADCQAHISANNMYTVLCYIPKQ